VPESVYAQVTKLGIRGVYGSRVYQARLSRTTRWRPTSSGTSTARSGPSRASSITRISTCAGENGWLESEKDGRSHELAQFRTREVPASDGYNVSLTIDATIQHIVEDELATIAEKYDPQKATIIVSDPQTGFILALANYPSFDLNTFNKLSKDDQGGCATPPSPTSTSRARSSRSSPPAGALNDGLVTPRTEFDCTLEKIDYNGITRSLRARTVERPLRPSAQRGRDHRALLEQGRRPARDAASATGDSTTTRAPSGSASTRAFPWEARSRET
jgi:cell division protein FtsI (penicillin-binding protein 3)